MKYMSQGHACEKKGKKKAEADRSGGRQSQNTRRPNIVRYTGDQWVVK
jgi:hypothetical protein